MSTPDKPQPVAMPEAPAKPAVPAYETHGRRDPFESLEVREGAEGTLVTSAKLTGIVRRGRVPEMALVETSDGIGYILKVGDTLGNGRLVEIGSDVAIFSVAQRSGSTPKRVVLRLASD